MSDDVVEALAGQLRVADLASNTAIYVLVCSAVIATFILAPLLIGPLVRILHARAAMIDGALSSDQFRRSHPDLTLALTLAAFAAANYATLPFLRFLLFPVHLLGFQSRAFDLDKRQLSIRLFALVAAYAGGPILLIAVIRKFPHPVTLFPDLLAVWLGIPIVVLCILANTMLLAMLFSGRIDRIQRTASVQDLTLKLLELLQKLDKIAGLPLLTPRDAQRLVGGVFDVSSRLRELRDFDRGPADEWASSEMRQAAYNFLRLSAWIYFPQERTLSALREEVVRYLNIFLSGQLHELLRKEMGIEAGLIFRDRPLVGWRKVAMHAVIAVYLILPVLLFGIAIRIFGLQLSAPLQTVISVLYLLWVIVGFFSFSEHVTPDARALLAETIKAVVGRR